MLATTLPAEFAETDVIGQDVDDIGPLAELLFQGGKLGVDFAVFGRPLVFVLLLQFIKRRVELLGERGICKPLSFPETSSERGLAQFVP